MRNIIFLLILFPVIGFSQTYLGVKGGYTVSTVSFLPDNKSVIIPGEPLEFGLVIKHYDNKYVGFQGELYYTNRGYKAPYKDDWKFKRVNRYIELPMFIQFRLNLALVDLNIQAGPYISYLLSAKQGYDSTGVWEMGRLELNILRDNRVDYGLLGGVGLSHEFGWGVLQADVRVGYGFADLFDYRYDGNPKQSKAVVQSINISYLYRIGKRKNE